MYGSQRTSTDSDPKLTFFWHIRLSWGVSQPVIEIQVFKYFYKFV
jgi:hypothetical protein